MKVSLYVIVMLVMTVFTGLGTVLAQEGHSEFIADDFTAPQVCGSCHSENFQEWEGSMHAASNSDPFYQVMFSMASSDSGGEVDSYCPRCHSPVSYLTGTDSKVPVTTEIANASVNGVYCDFCHTVKGKTGSGNGMYISTPGSTKFGPWDDADSSYHGTQYLELITKSDFCGICHYQTHTDDQVVIQNTFQEWLDSPYFEEGTQCQDCHMTPGPGFTQNPGRSTAVGPEREHIYTHNTAGGNIFQTRIQSPKHRALAVEMLKAAAELNVNIKEVTDERIFLEVTILNEGAGHSIPTGSNALRNIWLEVTATDVDGQVLFSSGGLDDAGSIDPKATIYGTVYNDASGDVTFKEWEAVSIASDNRIEANSSVTEDFTIKIPKGYSGPVFISTKLQYRTAPQDFIDEIFGEDAENVPVVEMAKEDITVNEPRRGVPGFGLVPAIFTLSVLVLVLRRRD